MTLSGTSQRLQPLLAQSAVYHRQQGHSLCRSVHEEVQERVKGYHATEAYKKAYRKRTVWVEPLFAEGKDWHGMRRFRLRRLWRVNLELFLTVQRYRCEHSEKVHQEELPMRKRFAILLLPIALFLMQAQSVFACGGLIAPDGEVVLSRATTLVAWHNGIEHYLTTFKYQGNVSRLGWIVPLPAVPLKIEDGGAWSLQRLELEAHPQPPELQFGVHDAASTAGTATVLEQVKIEALNITVIRGSGPEVLNWATSNGFILNSDVSKNLLIYAKGSPIFMAAQFDTSAAKKRGERSGDGTPLLITMKTEHIWVPLEVLALDGNQVGADLFLLTDKPVYTSNVGAVVGQSSVGSNVPGATGFTLAFQEQMNDQLYHDLSTDRNMGWVWRDSYMTYLTLDAPSNAVNYDMGVSSTGVIRLAHFGTAPMAVVDGPVASSLPQWVPLLPLGTPGVLLDIIIVVSIVGGIVLIARSKRRARVGV